MKITLKELVNSGSGLRGLGALPLRPGVAYRLSRAIKFQTGHLQHFEKAKQGLIDQFAKKDDKGNVVTEGENKLVVWRDAKAFDEGITALQAEEVEIPTGLKPIKLSEFDCALKSEWLTWLDWLLVDDGDDKKPKSE